MSDNTYIVTFYVQSSIRDALIKKLKEYNGYCPIHNNCWAILSDKTPMDILNNLNESVSESGGMYSIFVIKSSVNAAWINAYGEKHDEWLKKNL